MNRVVMKVRELYNYIEAGQIVIRYTDRLGPFQKEFDDVQELALYLKENPEVARYFKYVPKKEMEPLPLRPEGDPVHETMKLFLKQSYNKALPMTEGLKQCLNDQLVSHLSVGYSLTDLGKRYVYQMKYGSKKV